MDNDRELLIDIVEDMAERIRAEPVEDPTARVEGTRQGDLGGVVRLANEAAELAKKMGYSPPLRHPRASEAAKAQPQTITYYDRAGGKSAIAFLGAQGRLQSEATKESVVRSLNGYARKIARDRRRAGEDGRGDRSGRSEAASSSGEAWSAPMTKAEAARRVVNDTKARARDIDPLWKQWGARGRLSRHSARMWQIRVDGLDDRTRHALTN